MKKEYNCKYKKYITYDKNNVSDKANSDYKFKCNHKHHNCCNTCYNYSYYYNPTYICNNCTKCLSSNGILLEICNSSLNISPSEPIPFNREHTNTDTKNMVYNFDTNTIYLNTPGLYTFDWWLGIEGFDNIGQISISLELTYSNGITESLKTTYPVIITGMAYGQNLIKTSCKVKIRMLNSSPGSICLCNHTDMQGSLRIVGHY